MGGISALAVIGGAFLLSAKGCDAPTTASSHGQAKQHRLKQQVKLIPVSPTPANRESGRTPSFDAVRAAVVQSKDTDTLLLDVVRAPGRLAIDVTISELEALGDARLAVALVKFNPVFGATADPPVFSLREVHDLGTVTSSVSKTFVIEEDGLGVVAFVQAAQTHDVLHSAVDSWPQRYGCRLLGAPCPGTHLGVADADTTRPRS